MDQRMAFGTAERSQEIAEAKKYIRKTAGENERIQKMIAEVNAWEPPTSEHVGLKDFMLQQLTISLGSSDYSERTLAHAKNRTPSEYFVVALKTAEDGIVYHAKELEKERERATGRTQWVKQLRDSLRPAEASQ